MLPVTGFEEAPTGGLEVIGRFLRRAAEGALEPFRAALEPPPVRPQPERGQALPSETPREIFAREVPPVTGFEQFPEGLPEIARGTQAAATFAFPAFSAAAGATRRAILEPAAEALGVPETIEVPAEAFGTGFEQGIPPGAAVPIPARAALVETGAALTGLRAEALARRAVALARRLGQARALPAATREAAEAATVPAPSQAARPAPPAVPPARPPAVVRPEPRPAPALEVPVEVPPPAPRPLPPSPVSAVDRAFRRFRQRYGETAGPEEFPDAFRALVREEEARLQARTGRRVPTEFPEEVRPPALPEAERFLPPEAPAFAPAPAPRPAPPPPAEAPVPAAPRRLPGFVGEAIESEAALADRLGLADEIEALARQQLTAGQIHARMKGRFDQHKMPRQDALTMVRSVRAVRGIPSVMEISAGEAVMPPPQPRAAGFQGGRAHRVITERGTEVDTQFALAEAGDLIPSHDTALRPNPRYPSSLQPRARERVASEIQLQKFEEGLIPSTLGESPKASKGAPIIGPDRVVESGNLRTIALQRLYERNHPNAQRYRDFLLRNAEEFGLDPRQIERMQRPVLVQVRRTPVDRVRFAQEANEGTAAAMSATEQARQDASRMSERLVNLVEPSESGELLTAGNREFFREFAREVVPPRELGRFLDAQGNISTEGVGRVRNALFARVFEDPTAVARLAEAADVNIRNIQSGILQALPRLARVKQGIQAGTLHDLDLAPAITEAANALSSARATGLAPQNVLRQATLFGEELSPAGRVVFQHFLDKSRSAKAIGETLKNYADLVENQGAPAQAGLFGERVATVEELFQAAAGGRQAGLFAGAPSGMPAAERIASEAAGARATSAASRGVFTQEVPSQVSPERVPSGLETTRATTPPSRTGPTTTLPGETPPAFATGRMILQPANEVNQLRALAAQSKPAFDSALREVAERTPGLTLFGTRLKQAQRLQEKLAGGRAPNAVSDYLGARVWADTPEGFDAALGALRERFTILNVDDFREQPRTGGYRAVHAQVRLPNGLSAEVQLVPRTIGEIQEQWHGRFLGRWRGKDINRLGPEEARQYQADYEQATAAFDDAYARFVGRPRAEVGMGAPPAEAAGVPPPRRGPPPEAPPAPAPDPIPDPHEGIAAQLRAEPAERAAAARAGRDPLGLAAAPAGAPGPFARQAEQVSGAVQQTLRIVDDIGKRARIALEQEQVITRTGTLAEEIRPAFGRAGPKPETFRLRVSEEDVRLGTAELVRVAREWKRLRQQVLDFGDPMAANTVRAADALLDQAAEQWNLLRHATGRSVKAFDVPPNVRALLQEAGVMVDRLQAARPRLPIYTNIFRSLRRFGSLNAVEQRQFWRDLVDAWRLNLFSVTSWTLDLVGNLAEVGAQVTGGVGRDIYHAAGGRLNFPSLQGWTRAIRERARHVGQPLAPEIEEAFGSTVGGELVRAGFRGGPGTFTLRQTAATKTIDYLVGGPLYAKGVMDTAAKRLSATASLWRDAIEQANRLDLRGLARRQFYDEFFYRLPDDVIQRAIEAGNKAGFNRELTNLEERIARSVGFRLLGDAFARWPFQFSRTMGEWIGINPALFRKIRAGTVRGEEIAEYVTKSATGLGGLWLLDRTLYDRVDFNSMEYVHENGERTRLSGRDPIPTALWLLATVKGDTARSTAALRNASLPFARVLAGEPGLLGGLVRQFVEASRRADIDARAMSRELTNTVNRAIPGQALLSMVKSVFDPVLREGVGAQLPGVSLALPARVEPTTGKPLVPRQRIPGIPFELPAVGGIPIPGARRVTEPVFNLLSRFGLLVYRGPRQPIAGVPAAEVPEELRREWEEAFGKHRQRLLRPLADRLDKLERGDPERVRKMIQSRDAAAARIATQEVTRRHGGRRVLLPRQPTIRERRGPAAFTPAGR